jgi:hypothetical protein
MSAIRVRLRRPWSAVAVGRTFPSCISWGKGVRQDANLRSTDHFAGIEHTLTDTEQQYGELADVRAMIGSLRDRIAAWRQDFLTQALSIGSDGFKTVLADQSKLWADACARYGTGRSRL